MSNLNTLLRDIHSRADSLAIFAKHAAALNSADSTDTVQTVLHSLSVLQTLHTDLLALVQAEQARQPTNTQSYTTLDGAGVVPPCMDWLEDARYWIAADPADDACGEWLPCSRYYIGEVDGDSISVWLNDDMQEVEV